MSAEFQQYQSDWEDRLAREIAEKEEAQNYLAQSREEATLLQEEKDAIIKQYEEIKAKLDHIKQAL